MFRAVLSNPQRPEYGQITVPFPLREDADPPTLELLRALDLGDPTGRDCQIDEISGGEFQKVQIARAIVQEPSVLILDEPTNNLDISNQHRTMSMIMDAVKSRGMCTMMTMHDINLAAHYSDRFLFFRDGRVAAYGGPEIITEDLIRDVYGMEVDVLEHRGVPMVVPKDSPRYCRG